MALEDDVAFFQNVPTFAVLGKQALRILAIGAESRTLQSGAVLFSAGEVADGGYLVQQGSLLMEPDAASHGTVFTVGPGTLLGELALVTDIVNPVTATAQEPTTVLRISRSLFHKTLEGYPAAAKKLRDTMARRVDAWTPDMVTMLKAMDLEEKPR
jgi:CRP-like cAMP-binding protein